MTIGARLRQERSKLGLLEDAFGQLCGQNANTIISWENGDLEPCASALGLLIGKCDVIYILNGSLGPVHPLEFESINKVRKDSDAIKEIEHQQTIDFLTSK